MVLIKKRKREELLHTIVPSNTWWRDMFEMIRGAVLMPFLYKVPRNDNRSGVNDALSIQRPKQTVFLLVLACFKQLPTVEAELFVWNDTFVLTEHTDVHMYSCRWVTGSLDMTDVCINNFVNTDAPRAYTSSCLCADLVRICIHLHIHVLEKKPGHQAILQNKPYG